MEDELLKRFNALKTPTNDPFALGPSRVDHTQKAATDAKKEDDELEAIAEGRFASLSADYKLGKAQNDPDEELKRRMRDLKGSATPDETDAAGSLGDDEVGNFYQNGAENRSRHISPAFRMQRYRKIPQCLVPVEERLPR